MEGLCIMFVLPEKLQCNYFAKSATRFNLIASIFQKFSGGRACPQTPLEKEHALSALHALYTYPIASYAQHTQLFMPSSATIHAYALLYGLSNSTNVLSKLFLI